MYVLRNPYVASTNLSGQLTDSSYAMIIENTYGSPHPEIIYMDDNALKPRKHSEWWNCEYCGRRNPVKETCCQGCSAPDRH